jgi:hypothetical protein
MLHDSKKRHPPIGYTVHSRSGLEAWRAGVEATEGIAMMFGIPGGKEVGGGFVLGLVLPAAPVPEEALTERANHSRHTHGFGLAHAAVVVQMADVQPQM